MGLFLICSLLPDDTDDSVDEVLVNVTGEYFSKLRFLSAGMFDVSRFRFFSGWFLSMNKSAWKYK